MKRYELRYNHFGRRSVLINWPDTIDENILFDQLIFKKSIQDYYIKHKVEVNNAYNSILISYDSAINNIYNEIRLLKSLYVVERSTVPQTFKRITIPVCYAEEFGYDLKRISEHSGLSEQQIISLHSKQDYRVFFIGFLPGFPYLGGMDKRLSCPRLDMPRPKVEMGAVAI
ncbi:MAG: allophanate hydrolase subunit 1, partial [Bacteroidia bacterium]|nr:allophanate hydrolase subunit 1 [Bacteroidia bacterium]